MFRQTHQRIIKASLVSFCYCLIGLLIGASHPAFGQETQVNETDFKQISFDEGMKHQLNRSMPLTLGFPKNYEMLVIEPASQGVIWGTSDELAETEKTKVVPAKNGFFHARLTTNVGYDASIKQFICGPSCGEAEMDKQFKQMGASVKTEKATANGIPLIFLDIDLSSVHKAPIKKLYMAYIATLIDTNVMLISYRPAPTSEDQGLSIWTYFKKSLIESP